ncbi:vacuolar-type H+-ATPase subunit H [Methanolinea mesophila]|uniref:hypothetical protein n=1 Tax=Methanolinea mesophila TaxID=547055 RepID=UPI001AE88F6D|nr:hypothetical protein [Methanolinea mesophila]MBP1927524.1 vacuolar-type H+-ATPase subunit H [Methanolinea mesophila]
MEDEGSLLEIVQRKEQELKTRCDVVAREMESSLDTAKKEAELRIQNAVNRAKEESAKIIQEATASLERDLTGIRSDSRLKREMIKEKAEAMMPRAVDFIVNATAGSS